MQGEDFALWQNEIKKPKSKNENRKSKNENRKTKNENRKTKGKNQKSTNKFLDKIEKRKSKVENRKTKIEIFFSDSAPDDFFCQRGDFLKIQTPFLNCDLFHSK